MNVEHSKDFEKSVKKISNQQSAISNQYSVISNQ